MHIAAGVNDSLSSEIKSRVDVKSISHRNSKSFFGVTRLESTLEERNQEVDAALFLKSLSFERLWLKCAAAVDLNLFSSGSCHEMKTAAVMYLFIFSEMASKQGLCHKQYHRPPLEARSAA